MRPDIGLLLLLLRRVNRGALVVLLLLLLLINSPPSLPHSPLFGSLLFDLLVVALICFLIFVAILVPNQLLVLFIVGRGVVVLNIVVVMVVASSHCLEVSDLLAVQLAGD